MSRLVVIYDANVLYPAPLRDTLMHIGLAELCQPRWTEQIHEEWIRNLLKNRSDLTWEQLQRVRINMNIALPDAVISGYEHLINGLALPDPDDRHVLAAAIHAKAQYIITYNLRDFPAKMLEPHGLKSVAPDDFLMRLFGEAPTEIFAALHKQRKGLKKPPKTADEFLDTLEQQGLIRLVQLLRPNTALL